MIEELVCIKEGSWFHYPNEDDVADGPKYGDRVTGVPVTLGDYTYYQLIEWPGIYLSKYFISREEWEELSEEAIGGVKAIHLHDRSQMVDFSLFRK